MKLHRRRLVKLFLTAAALPTAPFVALASDYPTRPVHLLVGFFAGGLTDILARVLSECCHNALGSNSPSKISQAPAPMLPPRRL